MQVTIKLNWVITFWGSRDRYEAAAALALSGQLERLVTDFYLGQRVATVTGSIGRAMSVSRLERSLNRNHPAVPFRKVNQIAGLRTLLVLRKADPPTLNSLLGNYSARVANRHNAGLLAYSYYAAAAADHLRSDLPLAIFQVHPSPGHVRRTMSHLRKSIPTLPHEPEERLHRSALEGYMRAVDRAHVIICTSGFVASGLVNDGVPKSKIRIVPYGVSSEVCEAFQPPSDKRDDRPLTIGWLGQPGQRKGFDLLMESLELLQDRSIHLHLIGRFPVERAPQSGNNLRVVRVGEVSPETKYLELAKLDVFMAPSLLEGYGLAIHEALACGVPVVGTNNSMLGDLPESNAVFKSEVGDVTSLAQQIASLDTTSLRAAETRQTAAALVGRRTWPAFRAGVTDALSNAGNDHALI